MKSDERIDKISKEVKFIEVSDTFFKIGSVYSFTIIKFLLEEKMNINDIKEYIEKYISELPDDLKLLHMEHLTEIRGVK